MAASDALRKEVMRRLEDLPEDKVREVRDFILFLRSKSDADEDPVLRLAGIADTEPLGSRDIDEILYGEDAA